MEEKGRDGKLVHVYVIWDKWSQVELGERSEIIMDAAEKVLPPHVAMGITIAMGLTSDEAAHIGLKI